MTPESSIQGKNVRLGLFFTRHVSLDTWREVGLVDRELAIYRALGERGVKTTLFGYDKEVHAPLEDEGFHCVCVRSGWLVGMLKSLRRRNKGYEHLLRAAGDVDLIKTNQFAGGREALATATLASKPLIARSGFIPSLTAALDRRPPGYVQSLEDEESEVIDRAAAVVVTAEHLRSHIVERHPSAAGKIHVIGNYVPEHFTPKGPAEDRPAGKFIVMTVGRHHQHKGYDVLMDAMAGIKDLLWWSIGSGPEFESDRDKAARLGIDAVFTKRVGNAAIPGYLRAADVFIQSSRHEGHPKALLEAMAVAKPCLVADNRGVSTDVAHDSTGLVAPFTPEAFRAGLLRLRDDEGLRTRLGRAASEFVTSKYSIGTIAKREHELYESVLGRGRVASSNR